MSRTPLFRSMMRSLTKAVETEALENGIKLSRRDGIRIGTVSAMAAYLNACATTQTLSAISDKKRPQPVQDNDNDIVIVGGGAAGLSAAYYLKKANIKSHVYEANDRLGGRIFTQYQFNNEDMFCERGGELIDTGHVEIQDLMAELGLELQRLPDPSRLNEVHYIEGRWHSEEELVTAFRPFARRIAKDAAEFMVKGKFMMPTYLDPISDRLKILDFMTLKAYLDSAKDVCPNWVRELIRVAYVGEYGLEAEEQSAINLVCFIGTKLSGGFKMFGESDELFRVKGGNSMLIHGLADNLQDSYSTGHKLQSIARSSDGVFQLLFQVQNEVVEVKTRTCILTLPFTVLRGIKGIDKLGLSPLKLRAIRELGYGTNAKLMLGFKSRYWREEGKSFPANDGAITTDLPFQGGWDTSRQQEGNGGVFTNFMGGKQGETFAANKIQSVLNDLNTVYPGIANLHDSNKVLQVWTAVSTARGSYICQKPGQYTTITGSFAEPECAGSLLFAGEHTSENFPGFMNGAVESGLRVATSIIEGVAEPVKAKRA